MNTVPKRTTRFIRQSSGGKRIAPINMRKEEHQYVIDGIHVDEVLKQIPSNLQIIQAQILMGSGGRNRKIVVSNELKKLGVSHIHEQQERQRASIIVDEISKDGLREKVSAVCKYMSIDPSRAYFNYIILSNKEGNVKFLKCTKEIKPDETDLRKKLKVLGATMGTGRVQSVLTDLNAKKYVCKIKEEAVKFVMCSKA